MSGHSDLRQIKEECMSKQKEEKSAIVLKGGYMECGLIEGGAHVHIRTVL